MNIFIKEKNFKTESYSIFSVIWTWFTRIGLLETSIYIDRYCCLMG
jgi:hypothetical protein